MLYGFLGFILFEKQEHHRVKICTSLAYATSRQAEYGGFLEFSQLPTVFCPLFGPHPTWETGPLFYPDMLSHSGLCQFILI